MGDLKVPDRDPPRILGQISHRDMMPDVSLVYNTHPGQVAVLLHTSYCLATMLSPMTLFWNLQIHASIHWFVVYFAGISAWDL